MRSEETRGNIWIEFPPSTPQLGVGWRLGVGERGEGKALAHRLGNLVKSEGPEKWEGGAH